MSESSAARPKKHTAQPPSASNFIRAAIEADLTGGKHASRTWGGKPGPAKTHEGAAKDPAKIRTRFPPEPNGYLHIGHAKSICLNFGLALDYGGACHLRFDDTNPEKEEQEYVDSIIAAVKWLGFDWGPHLYYASDYFDFMYHAAECLIEGGHAYVDSLNAEQMRALRGALTEPGQNSPYRDRSVAENLKLFREMRDGRFKEGEHVLRAKIDMASPNFNLRDPAIYRIRKATHHRTGDKWCVYPMYTYAHPIEDALECITHSLCTLEFEDQRPFYDWLLERLARDGLLQRPVPQQIEFARLNLTYVLLSKRKLIQLVEEKHVEGWDDPRMPTLAGARRRGYTPEAIRRFAERIGVSKADSWIEYSVLEDCMREHLNEIAPRRMAVLDPVRLVIDNYPEGKEEFAEVPNHPQKPDWGKRLVPFSRELWIEREDFMETPAKGFFRLFPGSKVRLRYGYVVECIGYDKTSDTVRCRYFEDSKSGTPNSDKYRPKGNIHWVSTKHAYAAEMRIYEHLFKVPNPGANGEFLNDLNPNSKKITIAQLEPTLADALPGQHFQLERHGYFTVDEPSFEKSKPIFNRTVELHDSWSLPSSRTPSRKAHMEPTLPTSKSWYEDEAGVDAEEYPLDEYGLNFAASDFNTKTIFDFIESGAVVVPGFQRNYVWDQRAASKLIESLMIGLPIPQVFLYDEGHNKFLVIDGQQRLMSIYYFRKQRFPRKDMRVELRNIFARHGQIPDEVLHDDRFFTNFTLQLRTPNPKKKNKFHGLNYSTLGDYKSSFDLKAIRSIVITKASPETDDSTVYEIFNRLNTEGMNLTAQEIRGSLYHSPFYGMLARINLNKQWRRFVGLPEPDIHMKDVEFLLRCLAMLLNHKNYSPSMTKFLDDFSRTCKDLKDSRVAYLEALLTSFLDACSGLDNESFHSASGRFSAAIFEAIFVAVCEPLIANDGMVRGSISQPLIDSIKSDSDFAKASQRRTTDTQNVTKRLERAKALLLSRNQ